MDAARAASSAGTTARSGGKMEYERGRAALVVAERRDGLGRDRPAQRDGGTIGDDGAGGGSAQRADEDDDARAAEAGGAAEARPRMSGESSCSPRE